MNENLLLWQRLSPYLSIVHHVHGRIRLRFAPALLAALNERAETLLQRLQGSLPGIGEVNVNPMACSLTLHYDKARYPKASFDLLATGRLPPEIECANRECANRTEIDSW